MVCFDMRMHIINIHAHENTKVCENAMCIIIMVFAYCVHILARSFILQIKACWPADAISLVHVTDVHRLQHPHLQQGRRRLVLCGCHGLNHHVGLYVTVV